MSWEEIFAEQASSGLSAKRFCLEHGIKPTSYYSATKRQRQAQAMPTAADSFARNTSPAQNLTTGTAASVSKRATFVSVQVSDESDDAILHRKNALFYKTQNGAHVGDLFMSLIHACQLSGANPFDYLT